MPSADAIYDAKLAAKKAARTANVDSIDPYYKIGPTGKSQAQIDAAKNAVETAKLIGGTVDAKTGHVIPPKSETPIADPITHFDTEPLVPGTTTTSASTRKVISTDQISRNGQQVIITHYDDGTTSEQNYGPSADSVRQNQNWLAVGKSLLEQYGVGSLWDDYSDLILNKGYDTQTAMLAIQSLPSWKTRFSANEARLKLGLPVLDPATYLDTEAAYKSVMISAGLPSSVYNDLSNLGNLMAKDVAPLELKMRIDSAHVALDEKDPYLLEELKTRFGLTTGDMILHILDPNVAAPIINAKVASARVGAEASRQGFNSSITQEDALANAGVTQDQARQGFGNLSQMTQFGQELPGDTSGSLTQQQLLDSQFGLSAPALTALKSVQAKRLATFSESGNLAAGQGGISGLGNSSSAT